jgi:hypothetical protein
MPTYRDLFDVHLKYADYVVAKSYLIHQYLANISVTGSGVEVEVRAVLRSFLPDRFRVTSGYIVSATSASEEPSVSPQTDVVIVDTLVPHSLWLVDETQGIEVVPREAVVGVVEVKRTITPASLGSAVAHLRSIVSAGGLQKDLTTGFLPGGAEMGAGLSSPYRSNPILGVIGLATDADVDTDPIGVIQDAVTSADPDDPSDFPLDFVLSLTGSFVGTGTPGDANFNAQTVRQGQQVEWRGAGPIVGQPPRVALARGIGFVLAYLSRTCGRASDVGAYFFNTSLL